jgi:hypothetical protein
MSHDDGPMCRAVSMPGVLITVYVPGAGPTFVASRPGRDFICTQDPAHPGGHKACDGRGHVLAQWPRKDGERTWTEADCAFHNEQVPL